MEASNSGGFRRKEAFAWPTIRPAISDSPGGKPMGPFGIVKPTVKFGSVAVPPGDVTYIGPTAIQVKTPPGASLGPVTIEVTNPDGLKASLDKAFTCV